MPKSKIAVVGGGIAGLSVSYLLSQQHEVVIFEQNPFGGLDGAACDVVLDDNSKVRIDVPFRIHIPSYYHHLVKLCEHLNIQSQSVSNSITLMSAQADDDFSSNSGDLQKIMIKKAQSWMQYSMWDRLIYPYCLPLVYFPRPSVLFTSHFASLMYDFVRFKWRAMNDVEYCDHKQLTLGEYLKEKQYSDSFIYHFLYPYMSVICTCSYQSVASYPASVIIQFWHSGSSSYSWRRFQYGSKDVVEKLSASFAGSHYNCTVSRIEPRTSENGQKMVALVNSEGKEELFDHVVIATQANHASELLRNSEKNASNDSPINNNTITWSQETDILQKIVYEKSSICVHKDVSLIPDFPPATKFTMINSQKHDRPMVNLHLNQVYSSLDRNKSKGIAPHIFETWNPWVPPSADLLLKTVNFERPVVTFESMNAIKQLETVQGKHNVWFCGSYASQGLPTLETAVHSSVNLAKSLGVEIPWEITEQNKQKGSKTSLGLFFGGVLGALAWTLYKGVQQQS